MENTNQKPGLAVWLYALLGGLAALGSVVVSVSSFIRLEIITGILFLVIAIPVFSFLSWTFGWAVLRSKKQK